MNKKHEFIVANNDTLPASEAPNSMSPENISVKVEGQRQNTRWKVAKKIGSVAIMGLNAGIGATIIAYAFVPEKFHAFLEKNSETNALEGQSASKTFPSLAETDKQITAAILPKTPAELLEYIKSGGKLVDPESFPRKQFNMNALMLSDKNGPESEAVWQKVDDRATESQQNVLIATKIENPENDKFMSYLNYSPSIVVADERDPRIKYHLFPCSKEPERRKRGAAIILKNQSGRGSGLIANVDFILPYCEEKTD